MESAGSEPVVTNVRMAQLLAHMQRNNLSYIVGMFVAYQMGILDKLFAYGSGVCS